MTSVSEAFLYIIAGGFIFGVIAGLPMGLILFLSTKFICKFTPSFLSCYFVSTLTIQLGSIAGAVLMAIASKSTVSGTYVCVGFSIIIPWFISYILILLLIRGEEKQRVNSVVGLLLNVVFMIIPTMLQILGYFVAILFGLINAYQ